MLICSLVDMKVWMVDMSDCVLSTFWGLETIVNNLQASFCTIYSFQAGIE